MRRVLLSLAIISIFAMPGCATVDVTKTAKGHFSETKPDDIEILMTKPDRQYTELATVSTTKWNPKDTAKMHNALRAKTAPLGANAVIIMASGIVPASMGQQHMWTNGVAIRYSGSEAIPTANSKTP